MSTISNKVLAKRLRRVEQNSKSELKKYSVKTTDTSIDNGAGSGINTKCCSQVVGGSSSFTRVGNRIKLKSLELKYFFKANASSTTNRIRIMVVIPYSTEDSLAADFFTYNDEIDPDRYRLLYDKFIPLVAGTSSGVVRLMKKIKLNALVRYDAATGDAVKNDVHLYVVSDQGTNMPTYSGTWDLRYIDP